MTNSQTGIDGSTLGPWEQIYTFVAPDGYNVHIHSPRLRAHLLATNHPVIWAPVDRKFALSYLSDNIVSLQRVASLTALEMREPIILCKTEAFGRPWEAIPEVLHVDGHHRLVRYALEHHKRIRAFLVDIRRWQPFRIYNLPSQSAESLIAEPILHRSYWGATRPKGTKP